MDKKLIFAPLIRVSTETQKKRGESLSTQRMQLENTIRSLGGEIAHWYAGQEHATPEQERKILDELMRDAQEGKFDAVIVCDASRWSRDNGRSKEDLKILKNHKIRFFVGATEYNLFNASQDFMLSMSVEMAEFHAKEQTHKSILNRIARAEKGYPSCGKLPYGRTFDKKTGEWLVDDEKKVKLEQIARTYLEENIGFDELGARFKMNGSNLRKLLIERSDPTWEQRFRCRSSNIDKTVSTRVPRLLSDEIISKVKAKSMARRTYAHGAYKYEYLLSRIIFDDESGYALTGTPNSKGQRYYKPYQGSMAHRYMVNADILESAVLEGLNELLRDKNMFKKAIFDGNPVANIADELEEKKRTLGQKIASREKKISNLVSAIASAEGEGLEDFIQQATDQSKDEGKKLNELRFKRDIIQYQLNTLPTYEEIEDRRERLKVTLTQRMKEDYLVSGGALESLSFSDKKEIILMFFGGKDEYGKRYGIYIRPLEGKPKSYRFTAYGKIGIVHGLVNARCKAYDTFSQSNKTNADILLDRTSQIILDTNPELKIKEHIHSQCHAYHGFGIYQR